MRKRRGFHLWKNIKKAIGKVGTLNLVLILMFAFFIWFNWQIRTTKDRKREHDWERADRKEDNNSEMEEMNDES